MSHQAQVMASAAVTEMLKKACYYFADREKDRPGVVSPDLHEIANGARHPQQQDETQIPGQCMAERT